MSHRMKDVENDLAKFMRRGQSAQAGVDKAIAEATTEPMTLIERLRNPAWEADIAPPPDRPVARLNSEQTLQVMQEAAAENEMLLAAIKAACNHLEDNSEDKAYRILKIAIAHTYR